MAITSSAKKAIRVSEKKRSFNLRRTRAVRDLTKQIEKLLLEGKVDEAQKLLPTAYKKIDKAAKMNSLNKNTASRRKSKLNRMVKNAKNK